MVLSTALKLVPKLICTDIVTVPKLFSCTEVVQVLNTVSESYLPKGARYRTDPTLILYMYIVQYYCTCFHHETDAAPSPSVDYFSQT